MRRTLILAVILAGGVTLLAAERATFIMDNGERFSGLIAARATANGGNLTRADFVVTVNNRDVQLPADGVALIDFAGGNPTSREINSLPVNGDQLIVLRDGSVHSGRLLNILRGDTVRWQYEPGDIENMPIRRIARIYMNPDASRQVLGYNTGQYGSRNGNTYGNTYGNTSGNNYGSTYGSTYGSSSRYGSSTYGTNGVPVYGGYADPYGSGADSGLLTPPRGIQISAAADWVDTGIDVRAGEMLSFSASGQIQFDNSGGQIAGVDGNPGLRRATYPVPAMPVGGLIGKVGRAPAFPIGGNTSAIRMPADGRLLLGVNDDQRNDNSGAFDVVIRRR